MADFHDILGQRYDAPAARQALAGLPPREPEQIGDRLYLTFPEDGLSLVLLEDRTIEAVQFHADGHEEYRGYPDALPGPVHFTDGRDQARARLGPPDRAADARTIPVLGLQPPWDSFVADGVKLHLVYTPDADAIRMVTLTRA